MITKQQVKSEQIKRKQICSLYFVSVFKLQGNEFKTVQKNLQGMKIILIKKQRSLGKATATMIITGEVWTFKGQRLAVIDH